MYSLILLGVDHPFTWLQKCLKVSIVIYLSMFTHYQSQFGKFYIEGIRIIRASIYFRIPFDHVMTKAVFELQTKISEGMRPEIYNNLSEEASDFLKRLLDNFAAKLFKFRCWDVEASKRPTIHDILEFVNNTGFLHADLKHSVNECRTSFENLTGL